MLYARRTRASSAARFRGAGHGLARDQARFDQVMVSLTPAIPHPVEQKPRRSPADSTRVKFDRRQRWQKRLPKGNIIYAYDGEVLSDATAAAMQRRIGPQRDVVVEADRRAAFGKVRDDAVDDLGSILPRRRAPEDKRLVKLDAPLGRSGPDAVEPVLPGARVIKAANHRETFKTGFEQVGGSKIAGLSVVSPDIVRLEIFHIPDRDHVWRCACPQNGEIVRRCAVGGTDQESRDALRQQGVDQSRLSGGVVMRVRDDRQITGLVGARLKIRKKLGEERIRRVVQNGAEQSGLTRAQPDSRGVADKAHLIRDLSYDLLGFRGNPPSSRQRIGYRRR
ncbi:hypothetical protein MPL1032_130268 [Mesorhizobium plurifarium]|uniref:Uncharacterized protein n=1 Tax=Mesorhizobium plurifarium TaxID=69974 RepID=A0A0K2VRG0_MESPL|nr:hypothetical protein MPL1032_130268 [Mesorhizobium plurifarium]